MKEVQMLSDYKNKLCGSNVVYRTYTQFQLFYFQGALKMLFHVSSKAKI